MDPANCNRFAVFRDEKNNKHMRNPSKIPIIWTLWPQEFGKYLEFRILTRGIS